MTVCLLSPKKMTASAYCPKKKYLQSVYCPKKKDLQSGYCPERMICSLCIVKKNNDLQSLYCLKQNDLQSIYCAKIGLGLPSCTGILSAEKIDCQTEKGYGAYWLESKHLHYVEEY